MVIKWISILIGGGVVGDGDILGICLDKIPFSPLVLISIRLVLFVGSIWGWEVVVFIFQIQIPTPVIIRGAVIPAMIPIVFPTELEELFFLLIARLSPSDLSVVSKLLSSVFGVSLDCEVSIGSEVSRVSEVDLDSEILIDSEVFFESKIFVDSKVTLESEIFKEFEMILVSEIFISFEESIDSEVSLLSEDSINSEVSLLSEESNGSEISLLSEISIDSGISLVFEILKDSEI